MKKITIISAHIDDAIFSLGGIVYNWISKGYFVEIITVFSKTNYMGPKVGLGDIGECMVMRKNEDSDVKSILNKNINFIHLDYEEAILRGYGLDEVFGKIKSIDNLLLKGLNKKLNKKIEDSDYIFIPHGYGNHVDHILCSKLKFETTKTYHYCDIPYVCYMDGKVKNGFNYCYDELIYNKHIELSNLYKSQMVLDINDNYVKSYFEDNGYMFYGKNKSHLDKIMNYNINNTEKNSNKIMSKKISIIIPHLNEGYYLNIMLDSFYNYINYENYEIIICDDGSDDLSHLDFLKNHFLKNKITLYKNKGLGLSLNKNFGANKSNGEILIFLDSHMYIDSDIISNLNNLLLENKQIDLLQPIIGSILEKNVKGEIYKIKDYLLNSTWEISKEGKKIIKTPNIAGGAMVIKKEIFDKLGGFNKNFKKWGVEDLDISMRAWLCGYNCYLTKDIKIMHYFKESFKNTSINSEDVLFNKIIFTITCFSNTKRKEKILNELKKYYGDIYKGIYYEILNSGKIKKLIKKQQINFIYNDDWYFNRFDFYYRGVL